MAVVVGHRGEDAPCWPLGAPVREDTPLEVVFVQGCEIVCQESVAAFELEKVAGFVAYYWIDAGEGVMASLSVFEDKAGADESVKFAHQWIEENAPNLFPNPPRVTEGQVVASDTKK
jgi:hypothetical protein